MAHYVIIDDNNIIVDAFKGVDEDDTSTLPSEFSSWEEFYSDLKDATVLRTSINTRYNEHAEGNTPFRGNYGGIGMVYDAANDMFINPQPYNSWVLNTETAKWEAPVQMPEVEGESYYWNESGQSWELIT